MESCYGVQPFLHFGDDSILRCCGVQHGNPLGPLGFTLAIHPIIEKVCVQIPDLLVNAWYLDDGTLCGSADDLCATLAIIEQEPLVTVCILIGLNLCCMFLIMVLQFVIFCLQTSLLLARVLFFSAHQLAALTFAISISLKESGKSRKFLKSYPPLKMLKWQPPSFVHVSACPRFASAFIYTCPPQFLTEATRTFDLALREALSVIVGSPLPDWAWLKASLSTSLVAFLLKVLLRMLQLLTWVCSSTLGI